MRGLDPLCRVPRRGVVLKRVPMRKALTRRRKRPHRQRQGSTTMSATNSLATRRSQGLSGALQSPKREIHCALTLVHSV